MTNRERQKKREKRLRAQFQRLDGLARKGVPGVAERRDVLDERLKLLGIRRNAWAPLHETLITNLTKKEPADRQALQRIEIVEDRPVYRTKNGYVKT